ncbi:MAG: IS110 family transposase [Candidatus Hadarchaeota archaeon]
MNSYVGVDFHKDSCHGTVQTESGEIVKQGYFKNAHPGYGDFFGGIDEAEVVIEAGSAWQPVYDWLADNGFDVKLADPRKMRIIAEVKIKTDARDSKALADLLRADLIPEIYVPFAELVRLLEDFLESVYLVFVI